MLVFFSKSIFCGIEKVEAKSWFEEEKESEKFEEKEKEELNESKRESVEAF